MGNKVSASSKPIQGSLPPNLVNAPEISEEKHESKQREKLENPGTMEELHKKCKGNFLFACPLSITKFSDKI